MRTVLYADPYVRKLLSEKFVLHWSSERPVPKVTIDFGDGRVLHRTVTGNSAHYVITPEREVIDVLPGVYPAGTFVRCLRASRQVAETLSHSPREDAAKIVRDHHTSMLASQNVGERIEITRDTGSDSNVEGLVERSRRSAAYSSLYADEVQLSGASLRMMYRDMPKDGLQDGRSPALSSFTQIPEREGSGPTDGNATNRAPGPSAADALRMSNSKARVQGYMVDRIIRRTPASERAKEAIKATGRPSLSDASALALSKTAIDMPGTGSLHGPVQRKQRGMAVTKEQMDRLGLPIVDPLLASRARSVEVNLAGDAAVNELVLRPMIRSWFASGAIALTDFDALNRRVFSEVFLTPRDDPWLGMMSTDLWTGIPNDGAARPSSSK